MVIRLYKLPAIAAAVAVMLGAHLALAEGTRTWEQSSFDELLKGTANGVAIRSRGGLELAPAFKPVLTSPSSYIWAIASDAEGTVYAAAGAPARVYRITADGQSQVIFQPQELQAQSLVLDKKGVLYAATNPDGKVYRIEPPVRAGAKNDAAQTPAWNATVFFDPTPNTYGI